MLNELKTARLTIRQFKPSDVDGLFKVLSDADVMRYIEPPFDLEKTSGFIEKHGTCDNPRVFALIIDKSKTLIGHVIFHPYPTEELGFVNPYEIGFIIAKEFWRQGIASEIADALIVYAKNNGIDGLVLECDKENAAPIRIAGNFGFYLHESDNNDLLTYFLPL